MKDTHDTDRGQPLSAADILLIIDDEKAVRLHVFDRLCDWNDACNEWATREMADRWADWILGVRPVTEEDRL